MSYRIEKNWITKAGYRAVVLVIMWDSYTREKGAENYKHHYCGYVEVPEGHPFYEVDYDERVVLMKDIGRYVKAEYENFYILKRDILLSPANLIDVYGGLTFSGHGKGGYPVKSSGWWFGFDCNHSTDRYLEVPPSLKEYPQIGSRVWTLEEVVKECEKLAEQLKAVET